MSATVGLEAGSITTGEIVDHRLWDHRGAGRQTACAGIRESDLFQVTSIFPVREETHARVHPQPARTFPTARGTWLVASEVAVVVGAEETGTIGHEAEHPTETIGTHFDHEVGAGGRETTARLTDATTSETVAAMKTAAFYLETTEMAIDLPGETPPSAGLNHDRQALGWTTG